MRNLLQLIFRYHFFLLFVGLEIFSFSLVVQSNSARNAVFVNSANQISGWFYRKVNLVHEYFLLKKRVEELEAENIKYQNSFEQSYKSNIVTIQEIKDGKYRQQYRYVTASVINNSVDKQYNYITLDRGSDAGIQPDMAVITSNGIVGVVHAVTRNYASVVSVLNRKLGISAKIKKNNYFGSISWDGMDYRYVKLKEIPNHVDITVGDTVITSGFSAMFPEGIPIGVIKEFSQEAGSNFYDISLMLNINFKSVSSVYVVQNLLKEERDLLQESIIGE